MEPRKKKEKKKGFWHLCKFQHKKKGEAFIPYTSAFRKDLDYRNWKNKNKGKRIKMNKT